MNGKFTWRNKINVVLNALNRLRF